MIALTRLLSCATLTALLAACGSSGETADGAPHDGDAAETHAAGDDDTAHAEGGAEPTEATHDNTTETAMTTHDDAPAAAGFYALQTETLAGESVALADWSGKVALVVNVASKCGYTPQYGGLQELHESYADQGLVVLGFPSNEFGGQEPGSADQIQQFCQENYGVEFPMFAKCVTGDGAEQSPVYSLLSEATGELPNWNFCKYLVGRDGQVLGFYRSNVAPESDALRADIEKALAG